VHIDEFKVGRFLNLSIHKISIYLALYPSTRPKYIDLEVDADNLTPEIFASFPSKMTFSWFDAFAWTGWKRKFSIQIK
jgi:hypothetical protein